MKTTKDISGKTIVDFEGAVLPDGAKIEDSLKNQFSSSLINVLREFGIVGVLTYLGGTVMFYLFVQQGEFNRQVLYGVLGLFLLFLASIISYFRIRVRRDREKFLIEMVEGSCNRLAEQLGKVSSGKVDGVIQKIRQIQKELIITIFSHSIEK